MSVKFTYNETSNILIIKDNNSTKIYKLNDNKYDKIFKYIIKAIDVLDGDQTKTAIEFDLAPYLLEDILYWKITSGEYLPIELGKTYDVTYNGVTYSNLEVQELYPEFYDPEIEFNKMLLLGNPKMQIEFYGTMTEEFRDSLIDNGLPFVIYYRYNSDYPDEYQNLIIEGDYNDNSSELMISLHSDKSKFFTYDLSECQYQTHHILPGSYEYYVNLFGMNIGKDVKITVDGVEYIKQWNYIDDEYIKGYQVDSDDLNLWIANIKLYSSEDEESELYLTEQAFDVWSNDSDLSIYPINIKIEPCS